MQIVITGGAGFLGLRLARALLQQGSIQLAGEAATPITRLLLVDRVAPPADLAADARVHVQVGDLLDLLNGQPQDVVPSGTHAVVHLAAAVSGECEADFDLGMRSNLDTTRALLERCRALGSQPLFVFSSSLAVFGNTPEQPLPAVITDTTMPTPQNSYGVQKFLGEQLVADYARKGFVQGRNVRLMTVSVRPGRPNGAASSFLSGMIREPLAGVRSTCPVPADTPVALASPARTIEGLMCALQTSAAAWGARTAINLPALTTTPREMAASLEKVAGPAAAALIDWTPDPKVAAIVTSWPSCMDAARARQLGLEPDTSFEAIVRDYVRENPKEVRLSYP
jgi:nucleoside-diphosphate-sugar epimerase